MKPDLQTRRLTVGHKLLMIFYLIQDIVFPAQCVSCGVSVSNSGPGICAECSSKITALSDACPVCSGIMLGSHCSICSQRALYIVRNIAITEYSGVMKDAIAALKFQKIKRVSRFLSGLLTEAFHYFHETMDIISFVPMNTKKKWERGYNQSEVIARAVGKNLGIPCKKLLYEHEKSGVQRDMGYRERFFNVIGRYAVTSDTIIAGKKILLIDDVFTTGATVNECARLLLRSGAARVYSMTLARTNIRVD